MEKCEVLVATMNRNSTELHDLILNMKLASDALIVNQIPKLDIKLTNKNILQKRVISVKEKGLSRSRNLALENAKDEICIIADDDLIYDDDYQEKIIAQYNNYPDADIIAFVVENEDKSRRKKILRLGKVGYLKSMKLQSVQLTFRRKKIIESGIRFDEQFGIGAKYNWGEENIFLFDCLRKKLKIYYVPIKIAKLKFEESMWSKENTPSHYKIQGAIYYRMSKMIYPILIIQFALRKRKIYSKDMGTYSVIKFMFKGAKEYKGMMKNER